MQLGIHVPVFDIDGGATAMAGELARVGAAAEEAGMSWLSFMDHYFQIEATGLPAESPMLDGYTTLGFLAAHTSAIELGLLVTGVTYRHPGLLAKIVTTLDVLSGGRAALGVGAAWFEREHHALGVPFPPVAERFERLEETLRVCAQMWTQVAHKLDVLGKHCDDLGRDYDAIRKTITAGRPDRRPATSSCGAWRTTRSSACTPPSSCLPAGHRPRGSTGWRRLWRGWRSWADHQTATIAPPGSTGRHPPHRRRAETVRSQCGTHSVTRVPRPGADSTRPVPPTSVSRASIDWLIPKPGA
ncbi:LLM class flavin-dependent oxidoreductase [Amycolatopsis panacis]